VLQRETEQNHLKLNSALPALGTLKQT